MKGRADMPTRGSTPGIKKIPRQGGRWSWFWVASQIARHSRGFKPRTRLLWSGPGQPTAAELAVIGQECELLTGNLRAWQAGDKPPRPRTIRVGTIYFLEGAEGLIKIGFSRDVKQRQATLQVGSASVHKLLGTLVGSNRMERELHHRFRRLRVRGEWHRPEKPLLDFIAAEVAPPQEQAAA
jgi:hypothetical protein